MTVVGSILQATVQRVQSLHKEGGWRAVWVEKPVAISPMNIPVAFRKKWEEDGIGLDDC